ncbi:MAG: ABC transporter substrate-binding protein [Lachnospiraceae bacterium]|nr:ABC transporter substrate-binding protein [Lachnospiraceae bacterium]
MKKLICLLLTIAMTCTLFAGCAVPVADTQSTAGAASEESASEESAETVSEAGEKSSDSDLVPMKIAFCTWVGYAPLFIAKEQGYFEENGIDAEIVIIEDESTYGAAFVSNSIQALGQVLDRDIIQYNAGAPEQYVCTMDASTGGDGLVATEDIKTMDDLAGRTVALDKSATSYFFFLQALMDSSITEDQINIVEMGNDEAGEAFLAGNVDAAVTWEPALSSCSEREGGHKLVTSADYPKAIIDVLTVNSNFAQDHPDIYDKLSDCWYRSVDYLNDNYDDGCRIMAEGLGLETDEVKEECAGITFYDKAMNESFNDKNTEQNVVEIADMAADFWVEKGYMNSKDLTGFFPTIK